MLDAIKALVGAANVLTGEEARPFLTDWRGRFAGQAIAVVRPGKTPEVAAVVRCCAEQGIPIVAQGGNTGLAGGATPDATGRSIVLQMTRLNRIREIDPANDTMTVEAGCLLQRIQEAARDAGRLFPLSLAAEGSCTIGGNIATNAGGTQVLRYGNMRDLTLGLEVVTATGEVWEGLRGLRKDNTGYDLRSLFIGSEGTLGIVTAATLKLYPLPAARCTALLAVPTLGNAVTMLARCRGGLGPTLTAFEVMNAVCLDTVASVYRQQRLPLDTGAAPWFVLVEMSDAEGEAHARERLELVLVAALDKGEIVDAVVAESVAQSKALWHLRESIPLAQAAAGTSIKHDIALPVSEIPKFVQSTDLALQQHFPGIVNMTFGHLGDGNLHYNVGTSSRFDGALLLESQDRISRLIHDAVEAHRGSFSAEHGVGQSKVDELSRYKGSLEVLMMRSVKHALDPRGVFNPGKLLGPAT